MKRVGLILSLALLTAMMVISRGGNAFNEETIGKQVSMAENLNVDNIRNGDPTPDAQSDEEWETIETFTGSGTKNTAAFSVSSREWRVVYESRSAIKGMKGMGHILQLYLLRPGEEMYEGEIIANVANKEYIEGKSSVYKSGKFYFKSNSANGDWKIEVQVKN